MACWGCGQRRDILDEAKDKSIVEKAKAIKRVAVHMMKYPPRIGARK